MHSNIIYSIIKPFWIWIDNYISKYTIKPLLPWSASELRASRIWYSQPPSSRPTWGVNIPFYWRPRTITRNKLQKLVPGTRLCVTGSRSNRSGFCCSPPRLRTWLGRSIWWSWSWCRRCWWLHGSQSGDRRIWISKEYF